MAKRNPKQTKFFVELHNNSSNTRFKQTIEATNENELIKHINKVYFDTEIIEIKTDVDNER